MTLNLSLLDLLVLSLATWRTAYFISRDHAPFGVMDKLRDRLVKDRTKPTILTCVICSSVWAAALMLVLWHTPLQPLVWIAAVSGAALMLASYTGVNHPQ